MSFDAAEYFAKKHGGFDALMKLLDMFNAGDDLATIGQYFKLSQSQVCRIRAELFRQVWIPTPGTLEYIDFQKSVHEREAMRREKFIKEQKTNLKLYGQSDN